MGFWGCGGVEWGGVGWGGLVREIVADDGWRSVESGRLGSVLPALHLPCVDAEQRLLLRLLPIVFPRPLRPLPSSSSCSSIPPDHQRGGRQAVLLRVREEDSDRHPPHFLSSCSRSRSRCCCRGGAVCSRAASAAAAAAAAGVARQEAAGVMRMMVGVPAKQRVSQSSSQSGEVNRSHARASAPFFWRRRVVQCIVHSPEDAAGPPSASHHGGQSILLDAPPVFMHMLGVRGGRHGVSGLLSMGAGRMMVERLLDGD